ncbi:ACT domain-containing protein [Tissierella creatinini]|nr:ACT domain-containing protein [Tissierella creatinini]TJX66647.1 ACT domain-containing protein [Soehngenia saccharolytica]
MISQVSVFLENKPGRLEKVLEILNDNEISLRSISVAETSDYGIFRLILDRPKDAVEKLKEAGFAVKETDVLGLEIDDTKGSMLNAIKELASNQISIEYTYACLPINNDKVIIIVRVDNMEKAKEVLKDSKNCRLLDCDDICFIDK